MTARPPLTPARITGALFFLAAAAHTLTQHSAIAWSLGVAVAPVWAFSVMGAGLFWAFATELFGDRPRLAPIRFAPAAVLLVVGLGMVPTSGAARDVARLTHHLIGAALMVHVLIVTWNGWRNDLVESRRRLRGPILGAAALYAVSVIAVQIAEVVWGPATFLSPVAAVALLILGLAGIGVLLQADQELFASPSPARASTEPVAAGGTIAVSGEEARLADKLDRLMRIDRAYRDEKLSIGALASKLGMPEYRLRRLINQQLGHRNFNAYLNQWRLADAKQALADPAQREVPISTIAIDAGFQSLGPFNRAFRAETGFTPTEFRARTASAPANVTG